MLSGNSKNVGGFSDKSTSPLIVAGPNSVNSAFPIDMFGNKSPSVSPIKVDSNVWTSVSCGGSHTVAVKYDGTLWAWGSNAYGQVGDGTTTERTSPVQIGSDTNWSKIAAGGRHNMAIKTTGTLYAWGQNAGGQFGVTTNTGRGAPTEQDNKRNVRAPMEVGTLIDNRSSSIWAYAIPGKNWEKDYNYYYYYYYDTDGTRIDPYISNTLAAATIYPNAKT